MDVGDARSLSADAKEALRRRAVAAVLKGEKQVVVAERFGVTRQAVCGWVAAHRAGGQRALAAKPQGRPQGTGRLVGWQAAWVKRTVVGKCPDQMQLPGLLWTRELVRELIWRKFSIEVSVATVGRYLKRWGLTVQKPSKRAFEQDSEKVRQWLEEHYPRIRERASEQGAMILWGDEAGVRSDHQTGTTWGVRGTTPVVGRSGQRFKTNTISCVSNEGAMRFMVFDGRFTQSVFIDFLRRVVKGSDRKVFLIVDNHPVHRGKKVAAWLKDHADDIWMIRLPGYSPELNPDELLNNDLKNHVGKTSATSQGDLTSSVRTHLRRRQRQPHVVRGFFEHPNTRYAAQ